jgi:zinc D-Ala-D-Ala carboxypeptidase
MTQLSQHFTLAELTHTAQPFANVPGSVEAKSLANLCEHVLEPIRAHFGPVKVNSGYRSPQVNAAVGSHPGSQHARGEAADIEVAGVSNADLAKWIRNNIVFDQLILEAYRPGIAGSGWVHVSWKLGPLRKSMLTMTMGSHGPVYTPGIVA